MNFVCSRDRTDLGILFYPSIQKLLLFLILFHSAHGFHPLSRQQGIRASVISIHPTSCSRCHLAMAASVTDSTPLPIQNCGDDNTQKSQRKKIDLRRKIPYVESFEEQVSRELWERHPFDSTQHVVNKIIGSVTDEGDDNNNLDDRNTTELPAILTRIDINSELPSKSEKHPSTVVSSFPLSGYEESFDRLYQVVPPNNQSSSVDTYTHPTTTNKIILGTARIQTSPFAQIVDDHETKKEKLRHFCLTVAYRGEDFCGWQTQLHNLEQPSVQRTLEEWLTQLQAETPLTAEDYAKPQRTNFPKHQSDLPNDLSPPHNVTTKTRRHRKSSVKWADLPVAGRTDSGVSAIGQLCRFRTHRKELTPGNIQTYLHEKVQTTPGLSRALRVTDITPVTRAFHPTFSTVCRAYAYLIDIDNGSTTSKGSSFGLFCREQAEEQVALLDGMLRNLQGKPLDYIGLSYGKVKTTNTLCTLLHARARLVQYSCEAPLGTGRHLPNTRTAVCIELVGDRFLRRMVRLLVEASVRLAATATSTKHEPPEDALLNLIQKQDRTLVGRPAPPNGLIFVAARVESKE